MPVFLSGPLLKFAILGLVLIGLATTIFVQHKMLVADGVEIKGYTAQLDTAISNTKLANAAVDQCKAANTATLGQLDKVRADDQAAIDAITADRDRLAVQGPQIVTIEKEIHDAPICKGVPDRIRAATRWLREHPDNPGDPSGAGDRQGSGSRGQGTSGPENLPGRTSTAGR